jgi:hypothetical protein
MQFFCQPVARKSQRLHELRFENVAGMIE